MNQCGKQRIEHPECRESYPDTIDKERAGEIRKNDAATPSGSPQAWGLRLRSEMPFIT
jgi:hypothetical protein